MKLTQMALNRNRAHRQARASAGALAVMGILHLVKPEPFDDLIPESLPGHARAWTIGSGVAELGVAGLLALPATRRVGARAASALYVAVFPGNVKMAWDWRDKPALAQLVSVGRLPLQLPLIKKSEFIYRNC